jgi:hypothetical protein
MATSLLCAGRVFGNRLKGNAPLIRFLLTTFIEPEHCNLHHISVKSFAHLHKAKSRTPEGMRLFRFTAPEGNES